MTMTALPARSQARCVWLYYKLIGIVHDPLSLLCACSAPLCRYGPWFSWNNTARANIFRRDAPNVVDQAGFQRLIRYNDFQNDPLSTQACEGRNPPSSAENAIAARDDL